MPSTLTSRMSVMHSSTMALRQNESPMALATASRREPSSSTRATPMLPERSVGLTTRGNDIPTMLAETSSPSPTTENFGQGTPAFLSASRIRYLFVLLSADSTLLPTRPSLPATYAIVGTATSDAMEVMPSTRSFLHTSSISSLSTIEIG